MDIHFNIYSIDEPYWTQDTIGPITMVPIKRNLKNLEVAKSWIKENGFFNHQYMILPIYEVTIDDINERTKKDN